MKMLLILFLQIFFFKKEKHTFFPPEMFFVYSLNDSLLIVEDYSRLKNEIYEGEIDTLYLTNKNEFIGKIYKLNIETQKMTFYKRTININVVSSDSFYKERNYCINRNYLFRKMNIFTGTFYERKESELFYLPHEKFLKLDLKEIFKDGILKTRMKNN
jgi:hypothetical protein